MSQHELSVARWHYVDQRVALDRAADFSPTNPSDRCLRFRHVYTDAPRILSRTGDDGDEYAARTLLSESGYGASRMQRPRPKIPPEPVRRTPRGQ